MIRSNGETVITLKQKEALFLATAFSGLTDDNTPELIILKDEEYLITEEAIRNALYSQFTKKSPDSDRLNFKALRLL